MWQWKRAEEPWQSYLRTLLTSNVGSAVSKPSLPPAQARPTSSSFLFLASFLSKTCLKLPTLWEPQKPIRKSECPCQFPSFFSLFSSWSLVPLLLNFLPKFFSNELENLLPATTLSLSMLKPPQPRSIPILPTALHSNQLLSIFSLLPSFLFSVLYN